jgi:tRNA modification GTPase
VSTQAARVTGAGNAAIGAIEVFGAESGEIVGRLCGAEREKIGQVAAGRPARLWVKENEQIIDEVIVASEGAGQFTVNCHGNPLIVRKIIEMLVGLGAEAVRCEEIMLRKARQLFGDDSISIEAFLKRPFAKSITGEKNISFQTDEGLKGWARSLAEQNFAGSEQVNRQSEQIIRNSETARLFYNGCKVILAGPANSGKSTLFNAILGRDASITSDVAGTTRDYIFEEGMIGNLPIELTDSAGLAEELANENGLDRKSQQITAELIKGADVILLVLDGSEKIESETVSVIDAVMGIGAKPMVAVLNKADLGICFGAERLAFDFVKSAVELSAMKKTNIDKLIGEILKVVNAEGFDWTVSACFTGRQLEIVGRITAETDDKNIVLLGQRLLNESISV